SAQPRTSSPCFTSLPATSTYLPPTENIEEPETWLKTNAPEGITWRKRQLALMGDVSAFMKLLKQRFSIWFNRTHNRYGTLWS
ncbi:MAG: hypothetical protein EAZ36_02000, partial [Verrucomicrobia bacterium]